MLIYLSIGIAVWCVFTLLCDGENVGACAVGDFLECLWCLAANVAVLVCWPGFLLVCGVVFLFMRRERHRHDRAARRAAGEGA